MTTLSYYFACPALTSSLWLLKHEFICFTYFTWTTKLELLTLLSHLNILPSTTSLALLTLTIQLIHWNYFSYGTLIDQLYLNYLKNYFILTTSFEKIHFNYFTSTPLLELLPLIHFSLIISLELLYLHYSLKIIHLNYCTPTNIF